MYSYQQGSIIPDDSSLVFTPTTKDSITSDTDVNTNMNLAYHHSYGLFDNITDEGWEKLRAETKQKSWYKNPENSLERIDETEWWIANNMWPTFDCPIPEKIGGRRHEGTKFVCNPRNVNHRGDCLIYSVGSAGDFKWEGHMAEIHNKGCEIHVFDPANWT